MSNQESIVSRLIMTTSSLAVLGGAAYYIYKNNSRDKVHLECQEHMTLLINREKMLEIIEDLQIEFTPYYTYYYNLMKAIEDEQVSYHGSIEKGLKSGVMHELRKKIKDELDQKQSEIEKEILATHKVNQERFGYSIQFYTQGTTQILQEWGAITDMVDEQINQNVELLLSEEDKLLGFDPSSGSLTEDFKGVQKPDFNLQIPEDFTQEIYLEIINKIYACERYQCYKAIRDKMRESYSNEKPKYLTKQELFDIVKKIDFWAIRNSAFDLYGFGHLNEPAHRTLMKSHLVFMSENKQFSQQIRDIRQAHQRFMTDILAADVFPGMDRTNPLDSKNSDKIPDKYGKQWFSYEQNKKKQDQQGQIADINQLKKQKETLSISEIENDIKDLKTDVWNHTD